MPFATRNTGAPNMGTIVLNLQYRAEVRERGGRGSDVLDFLVLTRTPPFPRLIRAVYNM